MKTAYIIYTNIKTISVNGADDNCDSSKTFTTTDREKVERILNEKSTFKRVKGSMLSLPKVEVTYYTAWNCNTFETESSLEVSDVIKGNKMLKKMLDKVHF